MQTPRRVAAAIALGGAVAGTVDLVFAITFWAIRANVAPIRIAQSIASGLLGKESFSGGLATAALGLAIHYFIATAMAAFYVGVSSRLPILRARPVRCGAIYGAGAYAFMNLVVVPLSRGGPEHFLLPWVLSGIAVHIFGIGVPIAVIASRVLGPSSRANERQ